MDEEQLRAEFEPFKEDVYQVVMALWHEIGRMPTEQEVKNFIFGDEATQREVILEGRKSVQGG